MSVVHRTLSSPQHKVERHSRRALGKLPAGLVCTNTGFGGGKFGNVNLSALIVRLQTDSIRQSCSHVDRHTGWPCIAKIGRTASSADVIRVFRGWFADVGVPSILTTDGGPQFSSRRFAEFCTRWQVQHSTSSPHYPQSSGHAEAAVKAMKSLVLKTTSDGNLDVDEFRCALLEWRNTPPPPPPPPRENGQSPGQALFGRPLSSFVTAHHLSFAPDWKAKATDVDKRSAAQSATQEQHYDESARALSSLRIGMRVDIQDPLTKL